jgi:hypothetical protein
MYRFQNSWQHTMWAIKSSVFVMPATKVRSQMPSVRSVIKMVAVVSVARKKIILKIFFFENYYLRVTSFIITNNVSYKLCRQHRYTVMESIGCIMSCLRTVNACLLSNWYIFTTLNINETYVLILKRTQLGELYFLHMGQLCCILRILKFGFLKEVFVYLVCFRRLCF